MNPGDLFPPTRSLPLEGGWQGVIFFGCGFAALCLSVSH
jgi:hypothetical protein